MVLPVTCHYECPPLNQSMCHVKFGCYWTNTTSADQDGSCRISAAQEFSGRAWIGV